MTIFFSSFKKQNKLFYGETDNVVAFFGTFSLTTHHQNQKKNKWVISNKKKIIFFYAARAHLFLSFWILAQKHLGRCKRASDQTNYCQQSSKQIKQYCMEDDRRSRKPVSTALMVFLVLGMITCIAFCVLDFCACFLWINKNMDDQADTIMPFQTYLLVRASTLAVLVFVMLIDLVRAMIIVQESGHPFVFGGDGNTSKINSNPILGLLLLWLFVWCLVGCEQQPYSWIVVVVAVCLVFGRLCVLEYPRID